MFHRICIIGLGLIGSSLGLALHKAKVAQEITGYDLGKGVSSHAQQIGAIDQSHMSLADALRGAELIIVATPIGAMRPLFQDIATSVTAGTIVTDVASTKTQVISWAEEFLPLSVSFVGGHPMTGKETHGVQVADSTLFQDRVYCLTPTARTKPVAIDKVANLVRAIGARVRFLEPVEHDGQVAGISHLPFLASVALMSTVADSASWGDASLLAAGGFRDMTRLAAGSPEMYRDICLTNGEAIMRWLDDYMEHLQALRKRIALHDKHIDEDFVHAQQLRLQWQGTQSDPEERS